MAFFKAGKLLASAEKRRQYDATKPNCMSVRVAGFGKAIKMLFEEVLVRADERYQIMQSVYDHQHTVKFGGDDWGRTISFGDTGAFKAPAISCAFALTLPFRERMVLNASVKLFCLPCTLPVGWYAALPVQDVGIGSLRVCHRSKGDGVVPFEAPLPLGGPCVWSSCSPINDGSMSGNFSMDTRASVTGFGVMAAWLSDLSRRDCSGGDVE
jgi:hypothetical protein